MEILAFEFEAGFVLLVVGIVAAGGLFGRYLIRRFPPSERAVARQAEMKAHLARKKRQKQ